MRSRILALLVTVLLLAGCATQRIPFPESELSGLELQGEVEITGKVFLIDQFEEEQFGEEIEVVLEPLTSYSNQWYEVKYQQHKNIAKADSRYEQYLKRVTSDKEGKFSLSGVAPGQYLLNGSVLWKAITCSGNEARTEVLISKKITIKAGDQRLEIPLTRDYESPILICDLYNQSEWNKDNWEW